MSAPQPPEGGSQGQQPQSGEQQNAGAAGNESTQMIQQNKPQDSGSAGSGGEKAASSNSEATQVVRPVQQGQQGAAGGQEASAAGDSEATQAVNPNQIAQSGPKQGGDATQVVPPAAPPPPQPYQPGAPGPQSQPGGMPAQGGFAQQPGAYPPGHAPAQPGPASGGFQAAQPQGFAPQGGFAPGPQQHGWPQAQQSNPGPFLLIAVIVTLVISGLGVISQIAGAIGSFMGESVGGGLFALLSVVIYGAGGAFGALMGNKGNQMGRYIVTGVSAFGLVSGIIGLIGMGMGTLIGGGFLNFPIAIAIGVLWWIPPTTQGMAAKAAEQTAGVGAGPYGQPQPGQPGGFGGGYPQQW